MGLMHPNRISKLIKDFLFKTVNPEIGAPRFKYMQSNDELKRDQIPPPVFVVTFNRATYDNLLQKRSYPEQGYINPPYYPIMPNEMAQKRVNYMEPPMHQRYPMPPPMPSFPQASGTPLGVPHCGVSSGITQAAPVQSNPLLNQKHPVPEPLQKPSLAGQKDKSPLCEKMRSFFLNGFIGTIVNTPVSKCRLKNEFWEWILSLFPSCQGSSIKFMNHKSFLYFLMDKKAFQVHYINWVALKKEKVIQLVEEGKLDFTVSDVNLYTLVLRESMREIKKHLVSKKDAFKMTVTGDDPFTIPNRVRKHRCSPHGGCILETRNEEDYPNRMFFKGLLQTKLLDIVKDSSIFEPYSEISCSEEQRLSDSESITGEMEMSTLKDDLLHEMTSLRESFEEKFTKTVKEIETNEKVCSNCKDEFESMSDKFHSMADEIFHSMNLIISTQLKNMENGKK
eukprot:TRINITY_DN1920_c0_g1_i2.p1 TRINITY_DN1920_c0_g1~~TRINITY_DN1920_c0_g1_i2.p1  ORF type:complete len:450 (-),score=39.81 TRINITY_DN1920_c0_g1_i2:42-1391(-)